MSTILNRHFKISNNLNEAIPKLPKSIHINYGQKHNNNNIQLGDVLYLSK